MSESNNEQGTDDRDLTFWKEKWRTNNIGFHRSIVNSHFKKHVLAKLNPDGKTQLILFPLCGKSVDMKAILDVNHHVIGIECAQLGIEAFFNENNIQYQVADDVQNKCRIYQGTDLPVTIFSGDFFTFNRSLPVIDSIWDRGGLVAIDVVDRERYRDVLLRMMTPGHTRLYIVAMYHEDPEFTGPPNCLSDDHIAQLFGSTCTIERVEVCDITEEFNLHNHRNIQLMEEHVHLIIRK